MIIPVAFLAASAVFVGVSSVAVTSSSEHTVTGGSSYEIQLGSGQTLAVTPASNIDITLKVQQGTLFAPGLDSDPTPSGRSTDLAYDPQL